jgi:hypothetical protein
MAEHEGTVEEAGAGPVAGTNEVAARMSVADSSWARVASVERVLRKLSTNETPEPAVLELRFRPDLVGLDGGYRNIHGEQSIRPDLFDFRQFEAFTTNAQPTAGSRPGFTTTTASLATHPLRGTPVAPGLTLTSGEAGLMPERAG